MKGRHKPCHLSSLIPHPLSRPRRPGILGFTGGGGMTRVRIGNGCGFWGDNLDAPIRLAADGRLDYLTLEYLAELTMSILAVQKAKDPAAGFASDFLDVLGRLVPILKQHPGLKIVTNAGGMNPHGCAAKAREILSKAGLTNRKVGIVSGD